MILLVSLASYGVSQDSLLIKSIYFGGGSYYVDEFQVAELYDFINSVEQLENYEIIVFSHTDNIGGIEYNEWLSKMRGEAVVDRLLLKGIAKELIEIRDFGLTNPLYTNYSGSGRRGNRRVDVILWPMVF
ncbi:OmpA family protein [Fulvivirga sp. M361]|uniref:OmpA family protein n=1 Tax=Fulvivirga sp. M361 TaxID=2594266 RepID=UPI00117A8729|nr:OmpA family protein [Fulvivirga sp. M361]TRX59583.1 OmpA family protein [Fulvivirga sp. M361]